MRLVRFFVPFSENYILLGIKNHCFQSNAPLVTIFLINVTNEYTKTMSKGIESFIAHFQLYVSCI